MTFNSANGTVQTFVRDPRLDWTDVMSVSMDRYLYFTENQLFNEPSQQGGVGKRALQAASRALAKWRKESHVEMICGQN
jgi:hypothetical protein